MWNGLPLGKCTCAYRVCITLCVRSMYNIKKKAERGCFFNIPFQRLIPKGNEEQRRKNIYICKVWIGNGWISDCIYGCYLGGLEYTADEWNNPHSTISVNSEGALRHHLHCYIRRGYCRRVQPPKTRHTRTAKRVSTAPSPNTVSNVERVNASMVSRGGHSVSSPAGRSSALRPNCRHIYIYIHCRIRSGTR